MSVGNDEALARYKQYIQARGMSRYTVQSKTSVLGLLATFCGAARVELPDDACAVKGLHYATRKAAQRDADRRER